MNVKNLGLSIAAVSLSLSLSSTAWAETLEQVIDYTIKTNPEVLASTKAQLASREAVRVAQGGFLPTVDLQLGIGGEKSRNATTRSTPPGNPDEEISLTRREARLTAVQNLFNGFGDLHEVRRTKAISRSNAHIVDDVSQQTGLSVAESYLDVYRRREIVGIARKNVNAHERTLSMIKKRSEQGVAKEADRVQADGRLALARANLNAELGNLRESEAIYMRVVGDAPPRNMVFPRLGGGHKGAQGGAFLPRSIDEAIELARANHPQLKSAEEDIIAAQEQHKAAKSTYYPVFNAEFGVSKDNDIDGVNGTNHDYYAMLRMYYNLYNGGSDAARSRETAYFVEEASELRNRTMRQVEENIRLAWAAMKTNRRLHKYYGEHARATRETVTAYRKQFQLGQRTLLDLLDSENEHFVAHISETNAKVDLALAKLRLLDGTGQLLQALGVAAPAEAHSVAYEDKEQQRYRNSDEKMVKKKRGRFWGRKRSGERHEAPSDISKLDNSENKAIVRAADVDDITVVEAKPAVDKNAGNVRAARPMQQHRAAREQIQQQAAKHANRGQEPTTRQLVEQAQQRANQQQTVSDINAEPQAAVTSETVKKRNIFSRAIRKINPFKKVPKPENVAANASSEGVNATGATSVAPKAAKPQVIRPLSDIS